MVFDLIDYILGEIKMIIYKIAYGKRMQYTPIGKFSRGFQLRLFDRSVLCIGRNIVFRSGVKIRCNEHGNVIIGNDVGLNNNCLINAMNSITIGDHTIIGQDVKMYDHDHVYNNGIDRRRSGFKTAPISIGENVWIGSGCIILRGTTIGDNCVVAAGTVLKGNIGPNTVVYCKNQIEMKTISAG